MIHQYFYQLLTVVRSDTPCYCALHVKHMPKGCVCIHMTSFSLGYRQEAVSLVDAFDLPDQVLNSALGWYDSDVYSAHICMSGQRELPVTSQRCIQYTGIAGGVKSEVHTIYRYCRWCDNKL